MKNRKQIKRKAQEELMLAIQTAFGMVADNRCGDTPPGPETDALLAEMERQMARIEKLFGYEPGSWMRGC